MTACIDISSMHRVCGGVHLSRGASANCGGGVWGVMGDNLCKPVIGYPAYGFSFPD